MLKNPTNDFKESLLMIFTEEILRHSLKQPVYIKPLPRTPGIPQRKRFIRPIQKLNPLRRIFKRKTPQKGNLKIPEPKLPRHLENIKPTPTESALDLKELNPLLRDPAVRIIECDGPEERIVVKGKMGVKPTAIILRRDEIREILEEFSKKAKIPLHDGVYRVAVGRFVLSAIISTTIPPKFVIEKMKYPGGNFLHKNGR